MEGLEIFLVGIVGPIALLYFLAKWGESRKNIEIQKKSVELKNVEQSLKNEAIEKAAQEGRLDDVAILTGIVEESVGEVNSSNRNEKKYDILKQELKNKALESALNEERDEDIPEIAKKDYATNENNKQDDVDPNHSNLAASTFFKEIKTFERVDKIKDSVRMIQIMESERDGKKVPKISRFFDRYLPVITEIIQASKTEETDIEKAISIFNEITEAFYNKLYQESEAVELNTKIIEQLAKQDGLYDSQGM